jgi:hypothetical protein
MAEIEQAPETLYRRCELYVFGLRHVSIVPFIVIPASVASFEVPFRDAVQQSQLFSLNLRVILPSLSL